MERHLRTLSCAGKRLFRKRLSHSRRLLDWRDDSTRLVRFHCPLRHLGHSVLLHQACAVRVVAGLGGLGPARMCLAAARPDCLVARTASRNGEALARDRRLRIGGARGPVLSHRARRALGELVARGNPAGRSAAVRGHRVALDGRARADRSATWRRSFRRTARRGCVARTRYDSGFARLARRGRDSAGRGRLRHRSADRAEASCRSGLARHRGGQRCGGSSVADRARDLSPHRRHSRLESQLAPWRFSE